MKDANTLIVVVIGAIVIGGAGFMAGRHTGVGFGRQWAMAGYRADDIRVGSGEGFGKGYGMMSGQRRGRMGEFGEITKIDGTKVTLKLSDDTTKEVSLPDDAVINTMTKGTTKDLQVGQTIMVSGGGFWNGTTTVIVRP